MNVSTLNDESSFADAVIDYWDGRANTYSNGIWDELRDAHFPAWRAVVLEKIAALVERVSIEGLKVLDLGCGPGFFEILFSQLGAQVHAIDSSTQMLARAQANVQAAQCRSCGILSRRCRPTSLRLRCV